MILSILIATVEERKQQFNKLIAEFARQNIYKDVEVICMCDNKEMSIGAKRQRLLEMATGDFIVFFDDDDKPAEFYIHMVRHAIMLNPSVDCVGIRGTMTTNGTNPKTWCHRLGYPTLGNGRQFLTDYGYDYVRPIIHFNPVRRNLALQAAFKDMRFGEDFDYAIRLNPLLKKEIFISNDLFHYNYNVEDFNKKYGIK